MKKFLLLLFFTTVIIITSFAQTLVNKVFSQNTGTPHRIYNGVCGGKDADGNIIIAANTVSNILGEAIHIVKFSDDGTKLWESDYESDSISYYLVITDMVLAGNDIYVTGAEVKSNDTSNFITMRLDSNGNEIWRKTYRGAYGGLNAATTVYYHTDSAVLFVCGTEAVGVNDLEYTVIRYDSSGNESWVAHFDSSGYIDVASGMVVFADQWIFMGGVSGNITSHWDVTAAGFNFHTGAFEESIRFGNAYGLLNNMVDISKNAQGEIYILGSVDSAGQTKARVIKLSPFMQFMWMEEWLAPGSISTEPRAMVVDPHTGMVAITATARKSNGGTDMVAAAFDTDSNLLWERSISAPNPTRIAKGNDIAMDDDNNVYITGAIDNGTDLDYLVTGYTTAGDMRFMKTYNNCDSCNDEGSYIYASKSEMVVSGVSKGVSDTSYVTVAYNQWDAPNVIVRDTANQPLYKDRELIVRFNPALVNPDFVNTRDMQFANIADVLPDSVIDIMEAKIGFSLGKASIGKIFKQLTISDSLSITRDDDTIVSPKFWASLMVYLPNSVSDTLPDVQDSLNTIPKYIFFAGRELYFRSFCSTNDPKFTQQPCLESNSYGDINVCGAWDIEKGNPAIRIGIYDKGVRWNHEDFVYGASSKAQHGHNYINGTDDVLTDPNNDYAEHGTGVAGVAAAINNNNIGIAGVAGGDMSNYPYYPSNPGCPIYNMKYNYMSQLYEALVMGATSTPNLAIGYGLHVINLSNGLPESLINVNDLRAVEDAIRWDFGNGVITIAAAGNNDNGLNEKNYPASIHQSNMIIDVAGSTAIGSDNTTFSSSSYVDVTAPSEWPTIWIPLANLSYPYGQGAGTSYSAPLVSGTAALLLSHVDINGTYDLVQEDVEQLLTIYAHNNSGFNFGHGLIDAANTLRHAELPAYQIQHFSAYVSSNSISNYNYGQKIFLFDDYELVPNNAVVTSGTYYADVYEISVTNFHTIGANQTILHSWALNSQSNAFGYSPPQGIGYPAGVFPESDVTVTGVNYGSADLTAYIYHIYQDNSGTPLDIWMPFNIYNQPAILSYALHTYDATLDHISNLEMELNSIRLFPNPSSNYVTLEVNFEKAKNAEIKITDLRGRLIYADKHNFIAGRNGTVIDLKKFSKGMYFVSVEEKDLHITTKLIVN